MSLATNWVQTRFVFGWVRAAHLFSFLWVRFSLVFLRPVSCVPNVTSVSAHCICLKLISFLIMSI